MRWIPLVVLLLVFSTAAAPVPKHLEKDGPFWPTAVGTKWVYEENGQEGTQEIIKAEEIKGGTRLTIKGDGDPVFDVCSDGVTHRSTGGKALDALMLRLPAKAGDKWAAKPPEGTDPPNWQVTVGETKEVKVPAGTFRAIEVTVVQTVGVAIDNLHPLVGPRGRHGSPGVVQR